MDYENIIFEVEGNIATVTFNRPKVLNALNRRTLEEFEDAVTRVRSNSKIAALILTGAGDRAFVAGADINELKQLNVLTARNFAHKGQQLLMALEELPLVVIAAVNGFALGGGCELALACDFIYAADTAKFGQPEINLGIIPGFGGTQRLLRLVGRARAKELCLTGKMISAQEALEIGLVNKVVPAAQLLAAAKKTASLIASRGRVAARAVKYVIDRGMDTDLRSGCTLEIEAFSLCFASKDAHEGFAAFLEKRQPQFSSSLEE